MVIFAVALYESFEVSRLIGKMPAFWAFFIVAILFLILRRVIILLADTGVISVPAYWSTIDGDATLLIFSGLFLVFVFEMKKSFQRTSGARIESSVSEKV